MDEKEFAIAKKLKSAFTLNILLCIIIMPAVWAARQKLTHAQLDR